MLRKMVLAINELLRHFWAAFPPVTPAKAQKVGGLALVLQTQPHRTRNSGPGLHPLVNPPLHLSAPASAAPLHLLPYLPGTCLAPVLHLPLPFPTPAPTPG